MSAELFKFLKELADYDHHHPPVPLWIALRARRMLDQMAKGLDGCPPRASTMSL
jgi:hypothetical protein